MSSTSRPFVTVVGVDVSPICIRALDEVIAIASARRRRERGER